MDTSLGLSGTAWAAIYTLLTAGLLITAIWGALYARRQWLAAKEQLNSDRLADREASRPYVIVTAEPSVDPRDFDLVVRNIGRRPAVGVTITMDPPPARVREESGRELAGIRMLAEPIAMIAPGQEMRTRWDNHADRHNASLPWSHQVDITYHDTSGEVYKESSTVDLAALCGTSFAVRKTVHDVGQSLDELVRVLRERP